MNPGGACHLLDVLPLKPEEWDRLGLERRLTVERCDNKVDESPRAAAADTLDDHHFAVRQRGADALLPGT